MIDGMCGRLVLRISRRDWLAEFKFASFFSPNDPLRIYALVNESQFERLHEIPK